MINDKDLLLFLLQLLVGLVQFQLDPLQLSTPVSRRILQLLFQQTKTHLLLAELLLLQATYLSIPINFLYTDQHSLYRSTLYTDQHSLLTNIFHTDQHSLHQSTPPIPPTLSILTNTLYTDQPSLYQIELFSNRLRCTYCSLSSSWFKEYTSLY